MQTSICEWSVLIRITGAYYSGPFAPAQIALKLPTSIALLDSPQHREAVASLAERLALSIVPPGDLALEYDLLLMCHPDRPLGIALTAEFTDPSDLQPEHPAWFSPPISPRYRAGGRDPLLRAVGHTTDSLIDCTAGWCVDAAHFAHHGIRVIAVEQHPVVYAAIESARRSVSSADIDANLTLHHGNSLDYLASIISVPDVIYIDPMYPAKPGTAAPRRPLQILQTLHGNVEADGEDARRLLDIARQRATRRVVVKRPRYAPLLGDGASGAITGKLVRFDLYPPL